MRPERDLAYVWDMREAARSIAGFTRGLDADRFVSDPVLRYAVERQITILGEAARRISVSYKADHPEIPWSGMIGLRNVLVHQYDEVDAERIWLVVTTDVPELIRLLDPLVPLAPGDEPGGSPD